MQELLPRVELRMDPTIPSDLDGMWVEVEATTAEGRRVRARCERPRGIWDNPLTREERLEKFRQTAGTVLEPSRVARAAEVIQGLETAPNVTEFLSAVSAPGQG
jgi:2-methylcitrate dehydratase PrpD